MSKADGAKRIAWRPIAVIVGLAGIATLVALGIGAWILREVGVEGLRAWAETGWGWLQTTPPVVYFGAMSILTIFPVPISPFYIAAGTLYGVVPSLLWIPPAIALNNFLAYQMTTGLLRPWLQRVVSRRGYSIPTVTSRRDQSPFVVMVRITPGPPYFLQSLVLGLAGIERTIFLLVSVPVHMICVVGFVVLGRSAFEGELGLAVFALALIVAGSVGARWMHGRLRRIGAPEARADGRLEVELEARTTDERD